MPSADASSSGSDEDSDDSTEPGPKRRRLLLPACIGGLFVQRPNDLEAHGGRTRRVAHVEGNFSTLAYFPVAVSEAWRACAEECAAALRRLVEASGAQSDVHTLEPCKPPGWHVSVGPAVMLRRQFIDPLLGQLEAMVSTTEATVTSVLFQDGVEIFAPPECDRFFAAAVVTEASQRRLLSVAAGVSHSVEALGLLPSDRPRSMDGSRFHCSLAFTAADLRPALALAGAERRESPWGVSWRLGDANVDGVAEALEVEADVLHVKVGEKIYPFVFSDCPRSEASAAQRRA